jgi:hypothetical protein
MYYVAPSKTVVFKQGEASGLHVTHKGQELTTDVTAAQVVVWNDGKTPIRAEHVLESVKVILDPPARILDVRVRESSRPLIEFKTLPDAYDRGEIPLTWKILEKNDGAVLQITYAGNTEHVCTLQGAIEGQRTIHRSEYPTNPDQKGWPSQWGRSWFLLTVGPMGVVVCFMAFSLFAEVRRRDVQRNMRFASWVMLGLALLFVLVFTVLVILEVWLPFRMWTAPPFRL